MLYFIPETVEIPPIFVNWSLASLKRGNTSEEEGKVYSFAESEQDTYMHLRSHTGTTE